MVAALECSPTVKSPITSASQPLLIASDGRTMTPLNRVWKPWVRNRSCSQSSNSLSVAATIHWTCQKDPGTEGARVRVRSCKRWRDRANAIAKLQ